MRIGLVTKYLQRQVGHGTYAAPSHRQQEGRRVEDVEAEGGERKQRLLEQQPRGPRTQ